MHTSLCRAAAGWPLGGGAKEPGSMWDRCGRERPTSQVRHPGEVGEGGKDGEASMPSPPAYVASSLPTWAAATACSPL